MNGLRRLLELAREPGPGGQPRGAVALVMRDGVVVEQLAVGEAVRYGDGGILLRPERRVPVRADTIFDLASVSKLFTAAAALALADDGVLELDRPVASWLPEFGDGARHAVTVRHLLTHTAGLPDVLRLWDLPTRAARVDAVLGARLRRAPGTGFEYSCIGYIVLGFLIERATGRLLPDVVGGRILEPLGLRDTTYRPAGELVARVAATEDEPYVGRGMVRGEVHDENNWSLGGTAGNAGLFGTAADLARFAEMLLHGGALRGGARRGVRILAESTVREMTSHQLPTGIDPGYRQGLGPRISDRSFMGDTTSPRAFGHTGFTGTSLVVDPETGTITVLLTNRVHPSRDWSDIADIRRAVADFAAQLPSG